MTEDEVEDEHLFQRMEDKVGRAGKHHGNQWNIIIIIIIIITLFSKAITFTVVKMMQLYNVLRTVLYNF